MSARAKARALSIAERLAEMIEQHARDNPHLWRVIPKAVMSEAHAGNDALGFPLIEVEVSGSEAQEGGSVELQLDRIQITLWLHSEDAKEPQAALLELVADVRRAVMDNRQMADTSGTPFLQCGQLMDRGYTAAIDFMEGGAGRGLAEYRLDAEYEWTPATA